MRNQLILIITLFLFLGCKSSIYVLEIKDDNYKLGEPPGTIQIDSNLYLDKSEVSNVDWIEYMYWTKKVFGEESTEYNETKPDTTVWEILKSSDIKNLSKYFYHPAYRSHPIVGISYSQAKNYSKWRSDRVFEMALIKEGILEFNNDQSKGNYFSIAKFFSDAKYKDYHHIPFPKYDLIPIEKWQFMVNKADSLNKSNIKSCRQRSLLHKLATEPYYCKDFIKDKELIINSIELHKDDIEKQYPTYNSSCSSCSDPMIFHLFGNVREMTSDSTITMGGGWNDLLIKTNSKFPNESPNSNTGFRNICTWKYFNKIFS